MSNLKKKLARVEIMDQVCDIVKKFHSLPQDYRVTGESKLTSLNAESTFKFATPHGSSELFSSMRFVREILEQQFGIKIEEVHANSITTVSDLVVLIEELINKKTKLEIVDKVCKIVKGVFALPEDSIVTEESKFEALGGYSPLNMVWIMFTISKEFGIAIDADHASSITTVSDAAHLVEELIKKKEAPYSEDIGNDQQHYDQVKQEIVDTVCKTVKEAFALPEDSIVTAESKFAALGGYSPLNMVWVIGPLEEEFGITIEQVNAKRLTTVADAADLIIELIQKETPNAEDIGNDQQQQHKDTLEASKSEDNGIDPEDLRLFKLDMNMSDREFGEKPSENTDLEERKRRIRAALAHHRS